MPQSSPQNYLENQILTATPQELRRLLIEGALRFVRLAGSQAANGNHGESAQPLSRARAIVAELIGGVTNDDQALKYIVDSIERDQPANESQRTKQFDQLKKVSQQTMALYVFLFQELSELQMQFDAARLSKVIEVLQLEAETAALVCQQLPLAPKLITPAGSKEVSSTAAPAVTGGTATYSRPTAGVNYGGEAASRAISFEA